MQTTMKIRKGDNVMVLTGKDRGKTGLIEVAFPQEDKVIIKGVNKAKKHVKPSRKNPQGGIIDINLKMNASNVAIVCPNCGKPTRIGFKESGGGKVRICRKCQQSVEVSKNE